MNNNWFNEEFTEDNLSIGARTSIKIRSVLYSGRSEYQKIEVMDTESFGRLLLLDDIIMLTEENEFSYHEMIAHIPLIAHPSPKKVLIIGLIQTVKNIREYLKSSLKVMMIQTI